MRIVPYLTCGASSSSQLAAAIDAIFFEASAVQTFENAAQRDAFHWRWLGRYLSEEPEHAFLALMNDGSVAGYLVGSLDDPARRPEFDELGYFEAFGELTRQFPAHLHINVAADWRSRGVGARLIARFLEHVRAQGVRGVHVVTGLGMRNVDFYVRLGFEERGRVRHGQGAGEVVMLARAVN